jgi:Ca-activated chloride channel family protein
VKRIGNSNKRQLLPIFIIGLSAGLFPTLVLSDWSDWWRTPEQRALKTYESGDHAALIENSPNENWTALGQFQSEDFSGASSSFAKSRKALQGANNTSAATTALYNQGVSDVLSGEYQQAIEHFDKVLSESPEFADAQHNRDIATKLLELEEKQENSQDQQGEEGENGEQGEEGKQGDQNSEPSDAEQSQDDEPSEEGSDGESGSEADSESNPGDSSSGEEESESSEADSASEEQKRLEEEQARKALAAEALQEQLGNAEDAQQMMEQAVESEQPLSESEQATEQILRRIPDDPRGLLRRKLEQSHRNEFPEVRDAIESW